MQILNLSVQKHLKKHLVSKPFQLREMFRGKKSGG